MTGYHEPGAAGQDGSLPPSRFGAGYSVGPGAGVEDYTGSVAPPGIPQPAASAPPMPYPAYDPGPYGAGSQPLPVPAPMMVPSYAVPVAPAVYYAAPRQTNAMAIAALVCSLVFAPLGVVFGHIALAQINRSGEDGRGLAIAGLVIGYLFVGIIVLYFFFVMAAFSAIFAGVP